MMKMSWSQNLASRLDKEQLIAFMADIRDEKAQTAFTSGEEEVSHSKLSSFAQTTHYIREM